MIHSLFSYLFNPIIDVFTNHLFFTLYFIFTFVGLAYFIVSWRLFKKNQTKKILQQNIKSDDEEKNKIQLTDLADKFFSKREDKIHQDLDKANVLFTVTEYKNMMLAGAFILGLIGFTFFPFSPIWKSAFIWLPVEFLQDALGRVLCAFTLGYGGSFVPKLWIKYLIIKRQKMLELQIRESLESIADNLKAGMILKQAIKNVGEELPYPIGDEYQRVYNEMETGKTFDEAITGMAKRINIPDFTLAVSAMQIQTEAGGELEPLLRNMALIIQQRSELKKEIEKTISASKMTGIVLLVAPIFFLVTFTALNKEMYTDMVKQLSGQIMIALGVLFYGIATWLIIWIIKNATKEI